QDLVVSAVAHLAARQAEALRRRAAALPDDGTPAGRLAALVDLVAETFAEPIFTAALELWVAARTDPELHCSLVGFERVAGRGLARLWRELAGEAAAAERFDALVELTMHVARGMALQRILRRDDTARRRLLDLWKEMATAVLRGSPAS